MNSVGTLSLGRPPLPIQRKLIWVQFLFGWSRVTLGFDGLTHHQKRHHRVVTWQWHRVFPNPRVVSQTLLKEPSPCRNRLKPARYRMSLDAVRSKGIVS